MVKTFLEKKHGINIMVKTARHPDRGAEADPEGGVR